MSELETGENLPVAYAGKRSATREATPGGATRPSDGPSPSHPAGDGAVCRCGAGPHASREGFCARNHPRPGFGAALSVAHGLYALNGTPEMATFVEAGRALAEQSIVDAGGASELGARELSAHQYRGVLHERVLKLAHALATQGEFDKRGRLRKGWIELLERLIASSVAIDRTLGLPRKAKVLPTVRDIMAEIDAKRERGQ